MQLNWHYRCAVHTHGEGQVHSGAKWIHVLASGWEILLLLIEAYRVPRARAHDVWQAGVFRRRAQPRSSFSRSVRQWRVRATSSAARDAHPPYYPPIPYYFSQRCSSCTPRPQLTPTPTQNRPLVATPKSWSQERSVDLSNNQNDIFNWQHILFV